MVESGAYSCRIFVYIVSPTVCPHIDTINPMADISSTLRVFSVRGTSARSRAHFELVGDLLAYTAGGGIVVCQLDADAKIKSQRIFVANSFSELPSSSVAPFEPQWEPEHKRDAYGYPINAAPVVYDGSVNDGAEAVKPRSSGFDGLEHPPNLSPSKLKDKVKAVSCLAVSPNKKVLAVGESGYRPRILLYSLAPDAVGLPFAIVHEHSFGVKHVAFSPDLKYFCSLGNISDGFLHVWKFSPNSITLKASNKCSSVIHDLLWHDNGTDHGQIVTLGLRFLKCWTYEPLDKSGSKGSILKGRPTVLGNFLPLDFKEAVPVNSDEILLTGGNILFVYAPGGTGIVPVFSDIAGIHGLLVDIIRQKVFYFDDMLQVHLLDLEKLLPLLNANVPNSPTRSPGKGGVNMLNLNLSDEAGPSGVVKACLFDQKKLLYVTNHETIMVYDLNTKTSSSTIGAAMKSLCGLKIVEEEKKIGYSKDGCISLILDDNTSEILYTHVLPEADGVTNEVTAVELYKGYLFVGDKYGQLAIYDKSENSWEAVFQVKAHASTINELLCFEVGGFQILCSISRDRMIQLFICKMGSWSLLQTLPTHNGNLLEVKFSAPNLFVCSADRTISVHELLPPSKEDTELPIEVFQKKILMLKSTPLSMDLSQSELFVSTSDKSIIVYELLTFDQKRTLKPYNDKTNETLNAEDFVLLSKNLMAVACSDRSLRLFNCITGRHLAVGWGHSESILALHKTPGSILSLGADGCLFEWKYDAIVPDLVLIAADTRSKESTPEASPLYAKVTRKILPTIPTVPQVSPTRQNKIEDQAAPEPESPTPRLTNATLKRIEAKKKSGIFGSSPQKSPSANSLRMTQKLTLASNAPSLTNSLRRSPGSKSVAGVTTVSSPKLSPIDSPSPRRPTFSKSTSPQRQPRSYSTPSLPPPPQSDSTYSLERSLAHLELIKSHARKDLFSKADKERLKGEMDNIIKIFALKEVRSEEEILEDYSSRLLALLEKKISEQE